MSEGEVLNQGEDVAVLTESGVQQYEGNEVEVSTGEERVPLLIIAGRSRAGDTVCLEPECNFSEVGDDKEDHSFDEIPNGAFLKAIAEDKEITLTQVECQPEYQPENTVLDISIPQGVISPNRLSVEDIHLGEEIPVQDLDIDSEALSEISEAEKMVYTLLPGGSARGGDMLFDSNGYSYTIKKRNSNGTTLWRCTLRGKKTCSATLREMHGCYTHGARTHNHQGHPGALETAIITKKTKEFAKKYVNRSCKRIAEEVIQEYGCSAETPLFKALKPVEYYARTANYARHKMKPNEKINLDFTLNHDHIPQNFLVDDIILEDSRHLLLSSPSQLKLLKKAKTWYIDTNFKVIKEPFVQLLAIHVFVRSYAEIEQVPVAFALMSKVCTSDYEAVFKALLRKVKTVRVLRVVLEFKMEMWMAMKIVFPEVDRKGCSYYFTQAVFQKITELGMLKLFGAKKSPYLLLMKKLMCLCYLPSAAITGVYKSLRKIYTSEKFDELFTYMEINWLKNTIWTPKNWSMYGIVVRTNNDVGCWHNSLNEEVKPSMSLQFLLELLRDRAEYCDAEIRLISDSKLKKKRRKYGIGLDSQLYKLWKKLYKGEKTASQILAKIAPLIQPYQQYNFVVR